VRYEISVKREGPGNDVSLKVNDKPMAGTVIPLPQEELHTVNVKAVIR
jgi:cellobiose phosphorylase